MHRHEFLDQVHRVLAPTVYLEVGVQFGWSLSLARAAQVAIGIDPQPLVAPQLNQRIYQMTSDDYFDHVFPTEPPLVDFAFIDGDHHYEQALLDFFNIQRACRNRRSVVAFDDVLPYTQDVGAREMVPGDWAGDVWRVVPVLEEIQPDLVLTLVNVDPTGLLLVWNLDNQLPTPVEKLSRLSHNAEPVPDYVINRVYAIEPDVALKRLSER